jgi:hypothetical protein
MILRYQFIINFVILASHHFSKGAPDAKVAPILLSSWKKVVCRTQQMLDADKRRTFD